MNTEPRTRSLSPTKAGAVYGHLTPSPTAVVKVVRLSGKVVDEPMNRRDRRKRG